ncbi:MAG: hypothetical protein ABI145_12745 [Steroidobacteraceae bacterium]
MGQVTLSRPRPTAAEDFKGASSYLTLLFAPAKTKRLIEAFRRTAPIRFAAKDLLRASQSPLLSKGDPHVDGDLKRIRKGKSLPPVLDLTRFGGRVVLPNLLGLFAVDDAPSVIGLSMRRLI